jgi:similar to spore coat protein
VAHKGLGFHETMEVHELLNFKTVCLFKSKMMQGLVFDQELKALMQEDVQQSISAIHELQNHYSKIQLQN